MNKKLLVMCMALTGILLLSALPVQAEMQEGMQEEMESETGEMQEQTQAETEEQKQIYGYKLMTRKERAEYLIRMRAAKTQEERERIRNEHHEQMKVRAKKLGMMLPDAPPASGMGQGMGPGSGMGRGGGMGQGGGNR